MKVPLVVLPPGYVREKDVEEAQVPDHVLNKIYQAFIRDCYDYLPPGLDCPGEVFDHDPGMHGVLDDLAAYGGVEIAFGERELFCIRPHKCGLGNACGPFEGGLRDVDSDEDLRADPREDIPFSTADV